MFTAVSSIDAVTPMYSTDVHESSHGANRRAAATRLATATAKPGTSGADGSSAASTSASAKKTDDDAGEPELFPGATAEEFDDLLNWYDTGDVSARRDQVNAHKAIAFGDLATRGTPGYNRAFEQVLPPLMARLAALPSVEGEYFKIGRASGRERE